MHLSKFLRQGRWRRHWVCEKCHCNVETTCQPWLSWLAKWIVPFGSYSYIARLLYLAPLTLKIGNPYPNLKVKRKGLRRKPKTKKRKKQRKKRKERKKRKLRKLLPHRSKKMKPRMTKKMKPMRRKRRRKKTKKKKKKVTRLGTMPALIRFFNADWVKWFLLNLHHVNVTGRLMNRSPWILQLAMLSLMGLEVWRAHGP